MPRSEPVTIVVDTREQRPWEFPRERVETVRRALPVGDYSLVGLEDRVTVERKTLDDLVRSVTHDRSRFWRELDRMGGFDAACVVVEANLSDLVARRYRSRAHPNAVLGSVTSMALVHRVPTFFCSNRRLAAMFTEGYLHRYARETAQLADGRVIGP